jgi:predicted aspartyl protease
VARADRIAFLARPRLVAIATRINHVLEANLIVDTGAEQTIISRSAAGQLGIDLTRPLRFAPLRGVGSSPANPIVRLDEVQVGATSVRGLSVVVFDLPPLFRADGLLDFDFLKRFRVTFEFDTRTLVLREPPAGRS